MRKTLFLLALCAVWCDFASADVISQINAAYAADDGQKMWALVYEAEAAKNAAARATLEATQSEKEGDCRTALPLYEKACEGHIAYACVGAGELYRDGGAAYCDRNVKRDYVLAQKYFAKACELGAQKACEDLREIKGE